MRKIYAIGETLFDIIFKDGQPQAAKPGGAMLNSTVSLGRIGLPVSLISEFGDDDIGNIIDKFLVENGVETSHTDHFKDGRTALAIAVLNDKNDARYSFYKNYPAERLKMGFPSVKKDDIVLCGSIYAITTEIRKKFLDLLAMSKNNGAIIIYDPNFRGSHSAELDELRPMIIENMQMATIIRGSDEDFINIFGTGTPDETWNITRDYCDCLVYTASADGVFVRTKGFSGRFPVADITPVSTIGAGDNFNAGMIAAIYNSGIGRDGIADLGGEMWARIVESGVGFATDVCMSYENYISREFAVKFKLGTG